MSDDPILNRSIPFWTHMVIERCRNMFLHARKRITTLTDDEIHAILERVSPDLSASAQDKEILEEMILADDDKPKSPGRR